MHSNAEFKLAPRDKYGRSRAEMARMRAGGAGAGAGESSSSSDDDDSDFDEFAGSAAGDGADVEEEQEQIEFGDSSRRLAVMNMEWDYVKAADLFVLFQSFVPPGRLLKSVTVYRSEFGKKQMALESKHGPVGLWAGGGAQADSDDEDGGINQARLRKYERDRLKYFYAVAEFDSKAASEHVYRECDGVDFGSTGCALDLRYVPKDMSFDAGDTRDRCADVPDKYSPPDFLSRALGHSNVELSWDKDDPSRVAAVRSARAGPRAGPPGDLEAYLASDAESDASGTDAALSLSDSDDDGERVVVKRRARERYKAVLDRLRGQSGDGAEGEGVEIVFETGLKDAGEQILSKVKQKKASKDETAFERAVREKREKRAEKRAVAAASGGGGGGDDLVDPDEPDFDDMGGDPFFSLDDSQPKKKKKKKAKKAKKVDKTSDASEQDQARKAALELLVMNDDEAEGAARGYSLAQLERQYAEKSGSGAKKKAKKKKKKKKGKTAGDDQATSDDFKVDASDPRFASLYTDSSFAIDPTSPSFKNTQGTADLLAARREFHEKTRGALGGDRAARAAPSAKAKKQTIRDPKLRAVIGKLKKKKKSKRKS